MTTIKTTGKTLEGDYSNAALRSYATVDAPTGRRGTVTIDGIDYERTVHERVIWRNMGENRLVAKFVIVNGIRYEVEEV